jgi:S-adenosylmethionine decarboxylase proenzyme
VDTLAKHLLAEFHECEPAILNDRQAVAVLMRQAAAAAGARVVAEVFHPYAPHGVTGVLVIEESHFSVHTWPERRYAAVDFYTCGDSAPDRALDVLRAGLGAARVDVLTVQRGLVTQSPSLSLISPASAAETSGGAANLEAP